MTPGMTSIERLQTLLPQLFTPSKVGGDLFLRVQLTTDMTVGLSLDLVEEVQTIPVSRITPIPNMHEEILGLIQSKGYMFWLLDLPRLLGFSSLQDRRRQYEMIMINLQSSSLNNSDGDNLLNPKKFLGFAVQQVKGTFRVLPEDVAPPSSDVSSRLGSHVYGQTSSDGDIIPLLNI
ncbi:MAG: hypothetical protein F6K65_42815 [Moorea sp. SIO3C2]|nr:hypothetical protein [Moorena sp. SIO3C2]